MQDYIVVHLITGGEFKTPLVASQVFDRAEEQLKSPGSDAPVKVCVWIIEPFRNLFTKETKAQLTNLKKRTPGLDIKIVGRISRFNNWPAMPWLALLRKKLGSNPVIYHCRGEKVQVWAKKLKDKFPQDAIVTDIRGFGPLEKLHDIGINTADNLAENHQSLYDQEISFLKNAINTSEKILTVSNPLKKFLIQKVNAPSDTQVVPCCVKSIVECWEREKIRQELNIQNQNAILYLGGTQKYQHLEDLVFPFIKAALRLSPVNIGVIITQDIVKMKKLISDSGISSERIRVLSVPQKEVARYLPAMDVGLLLRAPTLLNTFSQPVKFGEYIASGIPVIVEEGTGELSELLSKYNMGFTVKLSGQSIEGITEEVAKTLSWLEANKAVARNNARTFARENYTWSSFVPIERKMYISALRRLKRAL
ncbi:MAG: hypothetical protein K2X86_03785 [Cytophagaceae bacterium]|nr:hypothetical protein [Cytophagaceae bacterium]